MLIIPAIDIRGGQCVRLLRGDPSKQTVYSNDPVMMAKSFAGKGVQRLHVVDLDGAFEGVPKNLDLARRIKKETSCEVEFGGGLRTIEAVQTALDFGIDKLILGSAALQDAGWVQDAVRKYPGRFIVGLDALRNQVAVEGWKESASLTVEEALAKMEAIGFQETIFTDINRDGTLDGPNIDAVKRVMAATRMGVYASGGVSNLDDVKALQKLPGLRGVIIGKAIYSGSLQLEDCMALAGAK